MSGTTAAVLSPTLISNRDAAIALCSSSIELQKSFSQILILFFSFFIKN
jgi:hypothetical protein